MVYMKQRELVIVNLKLLALSFWNHSYLTLSSTKVQLPALVVHEGFSLMIVESENVPVITLNGLEFPVLSSPPFSLNLIQNRRGSYILMYLCIGGVNTIIMGTEYLPTVALQGYFMNYARMTQQVPFYLLNLLQMIVFIQGRMIFQLSIG